MEQSNTIQATQQPIDKPKFNYAKLNANTLALDFTNLINVNSKYDITQIENALKNKDIKRLIEMSNAFYITSGEYRRLLHGIDSHTYRYVYSPLLQSKKKSPNYDKTYLEVTDYLMNYNVEESNRYITFCVLLNGSFYGYERMVDDAIVLQELPVQYCRSRYKIGGLNAIEFDFKFFDTIRNAQEKVAMFDSMPDEFLSLYNDYKSGKPKDDGSTTELNWRLLDINFTRCHFLNADKIPFFSAVFSEIVSLQEYKSIDKNRSKLQIYRLLVQNLPMTKDGEPAVDESQARDMHTVAKSMLGADSLVDVLTTGCEVTSVDLSNKGQDSNDIIASGASNFYNSAGTSQLIYNSGTSGTVGLTNSIKNDENLIVPLIKQYETHYNRRLKAIGKSTNNFMMKDLGITIYNEKDKIAQYKDGATLGLSKMCYMVATGLPQYMAVSMVMMENDYLKLQEILIPLSTSFTQSGDTSNTGGGQVKSDDVVSDTAIRQRDENTTENRTK